MCYLVAKDRNAHGCFALKTTHGKHLVELKRELNREVGYKGVQLVTISRPTAYGEYAPYHFVDPAIRNAMKMLDMHEIRLTYEADLPARSGLGTSSSFAVGMLNAFYALKGKYADKKKLADEAIYLERNLCQEAGGWQDQIAA